MSDNNPSRPLTRREIREREQAAAAARLGTDAPSTAAPQAPAPRPASAPSQAPGSYGAAPGGYSGGYRADHRPAPAPAPAPAPSSQGAPSRRSLRDQAQPTSPGYPTSAPVVRPPSSSGGMRGLDETGRLTPIQRTSEQAAARSARPAPASSPSDPARAVPGWRTQGSGAASAPAPAPATVPPPGRQGAAPGQALRSSAAAPTATPAPSSAPGTGAPARRSPFESPRSAPSPFGDTGSGSTGPGAGAPASASAAPAVAPGVGQSSPAPSLPWASPVADRPTSVAPASVPPGGSGEQSRAAASPFDALVGAEQPVRARAAAPEEDDEDDDWEEPEASYTWLHYIVLVVVAFVLGLLLWKLLLDGPDQSFTTDAAAAAPVSLDAAWPAVAHPGGAA